MNKNSTDTIPSIVLVGPPNSGKTTLFNHLSGRNFKTVNYPGSTIEYNTTKLHKRFNVEANLLDSPGIISILPNSPDEEVTVDSLYKHPRFGIPSIVIATVDASQLSRHLLLAKQLINSNFTVIVAVTMIDVLQKKGLDFCAKDLEKQLGCDAVKIDGRNGKGVGKLIRKINSILDQQSKSGINTPVRVKEEKCEENILKQYQEIEQIEKKVIHRLDDNANITKANKELLILNQNKPDSLTIKLDKILLHKYWGLLIFFGMMGLVFTSIFWLALPVMELVDETFASLANLVTDSLGYTWYSNLISNGIISSVGSVFVFVPQILILFLILGFLEDTGYLARGAMLIDKPLSKIGLNGRSFVPMLSGFACAIPAMLAARTISNRKERLLTIFIIPLMSCSARLPVYALLIGFLIPKEQVWVGGIILSAIYLFGIISSVVITAIINKFSKKILAQEDRSSFILELPTYKVPKFQSVIRNTYSSTKEYVTKAGPIIVLFSLTLWFFTYFPNTNPQINKDNLTEVQYHEAQQVERVSTSYAAELGKFIQPVMRPLGMDWRVGVSLISAFVAREVFVSSLALIFKVTGDEETIRDSILSAMRKAKIEGTNKKLFTPATILGLIVFFVFAMQCISTLAVSRKETGGWRIPILQIIIFSGIAYFATFVTVNGLRLLGIS
jgi:ferrous iron transport protein B